PYVIPPVWCFYSTPHRRFTQTLGCSQSFIYPIYVGLILLAGLVVGAAAVLANDIEKLRNEIKNGKEDAENQNKSTE
ncbi:hypothetical protein AALA82_17375, partial [Oscillospiraceae bacterium 50-16]